MALKDSFNKYHKVILYLTTIGLAAYGIMAVIIPDVLAAGFERFVGQDWILFQAGNDVIAAYVILLWRLIGIFNFMAGLVLTLMVWKWLRKGNRWSWVTIFIGTVLGYLGPMITDLTVGSIEVFEIIEFALFGLFVLTMLIVRTLYFMDQENG